MLDTTTTLTDLGSTIKDLREIRDWTQRELAERSGCSPSMISLYEAGKNVPRLDTLAELAGAFDTTPSALLDDAGL